MVVVTALLEYWCVIIITKIKSALTRNHNNLDLRPDLTIMYAEAIL